MLTCFDIADSFLSKADEDAGDAVTNLKLQKLVFYAQGYFLAIYDRPFFKEAIEAWQHGPVCPTLYKKPKVHGAQAIPAPESFDLTKFSSQEIELLDDVYDAYGLEAAENGLRRAVVEAPARRVRRNVRILPGSSSRLSLRSTLPVVRRPSRYRPKRKASLAGRPSCEAAILLVTKTRTLQFGTETLPLLRERQGWTDVV